MASKPKLAYVKPFKQKRSGLLVQKQVKKTSSDWDWYQICAYYISKVKSNKVIISVDLHFCDYITKTEQNKTKQQKQNRRWRANKESISSIKSN